MEIQSNCQLNSGISWTNHFSAPPAKSEMIADDCKEILKGFVKRKTINSEWMQNVGPFFREAKSGQWGEVTEYENVKCQSLVAVW